MCGRCNSLSKLGLRKWKGKRETTFEPHLHRAAACCKVLRFGGVSTRSQQREWCFAPAD